LNPALICMVIAFMRHEPPQRLRSALYPLNPSLPPPPALSLQATPILVLRLLLVHVGVGAVEKLLHRLIRQALRQAD